MNFAKRPHDDSRSNPDDIDEGKTGLPETPGDVDRTDGADGAFSWSDVEDDLSRDLNDEAGTAGSDDGRGFGFEHNLSDGFTDDWDGDSDEQAQRDGGIQGTNGGESSRVRAEHEANSCTVVVDSKELSAGTSISRLDINLHSVRGRVLQGGGSNFVVRFHHCKSSDFEVSNEGGTLHIANTATLISPLHGPLTKGPYVELIVPAGTEFTEAVLQLHSASLQVEGLYCGKVGVNLHSSSLLMAAARVGDATVETHSSSVKWSGSVDRRMEITSHTSRLRVDGLPDDRSYSIRSIDGSITVGDHRFASGTATHTADDGAVMLVVDAHTSNITVS